MISKELLSEVFGVEVKDEVLIQKEYDEMNGCELEWYIVCFNFSKYPIDYVAHKCKEWAWDKHRYKLKSGIYIGKIGSIKKHEYACTDYEEIAEYADTEPEAIFKAAQWLLDNNSKF